MNKKREQDEKEVLRKMMRFKKKEKEKKETKTKKKE